MSKNIFKGQRLEGSIYYEGHYIVINEKHYIYAEDEEFSFKDNLIEVKPETVSQSTGLKEFMEIDFIYENDIVSGHPQYDYGVVVFDDFGFFVETKNGDTFTIDWVDEVHGNIFEDANIL